MFSLLFRSSQVQQERLTHQSHPIGPIPTVPSLGRTPWRFPPDRLPNWRPALKFPPAKNRKNRISTPDFLLRVIDSHHFLSSSHGRHAHHGVR
jgi:hypothetical protein